MRVDLASLAAEANLPAELTAHPGVKHLARLVEKAAATEAARIAKGAHSAVSHVDGFNNGWASCALQVEQAIQDAFGLRNNFTIEGCTLSSAHPEWGVRVGGD